MRDWVLIWEKRKVAQTFIYTFLQGFYKRFNNYHSGTHIDISNRVSDSEV